MIIESVEALRDALRKDPALTSYMVSHYGNPCIYACGKGSPSSINEYPWISVTLMDEAKDLTGKHIEQLISVAWFLVNDRQEDYLFFGLREGAQIGELIGDVLDSMCNKGPIANGMTMRVKSERKTFSDLTNNFPMFSNEVQFIAQIAKR